MRDEYGRHIIPGAQPQELLLHFVPGDRIEGPKGFVEEQQSGKGCERTGDRHALALSARELAGTPRRHTRFVQANLVQQLASALLLFRGRPAQKTGNESDILLNGPVRKQAELLDDVADAAPQINGVEPVDRLPIQTDTPGARLEHPVDQSEGGCFSGPASPEQNQGFSAFDIETQPVQDGPPVDPIADFMEREIRQTAPQNLLLPWDN